MRDPVYILTGNGKRIYFERLNLEKSLSLNSVNPISREPVTSRSMIISDPKLKRYILRQRDIYKSNYPITMSIIYISSSTIRDASVYALTYLHSCLQYIFDSCLGSVNIDKEALNNLNNPNIAFRASKKSSHDVFFNHAWAPLARPQSAEDYLVEKMEDYKADVINHLGDSGERQITYRYGISIECLREMNNECLKDVMLTSGVAPRNRFTTFSNYFT